MIWRKKYLITGIVIVGIAFLSIWRYDTFFQKQFDTMNSDFVMFTGTILGTTKADQYLFEDNQGRSWILASSKFQREIGQIIGISGKIKIKANKGEHTRTKANDGNKAKKTNDASNGFEYDKWLMMKGYVGVIGVQSYWGIGVSDGWLLRSKRRLSHCIQHYYSGSRSALLEGMLIGSRNRLTQDQYQGFIDSGLVHLIAVSGGNMLMIALLLRLLFFWMPYYIRLSIISLGLIGYAFLCGLDSSVVRALIMGLLGILALFAGRRVNILRITVITMAVMLFWNPYFLIYDLGFALSFGAVFGLIIVGQWRKKLIDPWIDGKASRLFLGVLSQYLIPSLGATMGVLPFLLFFSGQYNLTSILGNILIAPLVPIISIGGFASLVLGSWGLPVDWLIWAIGGLLQFIFDMSDWIQSHGLWVVVGG